MKEISDHLDSRSFSHSDNASKLSVSAEEMHAFFKSEKSPTSSHAHTAEFLDMGTAHNLYEKNGKSEHSEVQLLSGIQFHPENIGKAIGIAANYVGAFLHSPEQQAAEAKRQGEVVSGVAIGAAKALGTLAVAGIAAGLDPIGAAKHIAETGGHIAEAIIQHPVESLDKAWAGAADQARALGRMSPRQVGEVAGAAGVMNAIPGLGEFLGPLGGTMAKVAEGDALGAWGGAIAKIAEGDALNGLRGTIAKIAEEGGAAGKALEAAGNLAKRLHPVEEAKTIGSEIAETAKKGWEEIGKVAVAAPKEVKIGAKVAPEIHEIAEVPSFSPDSNWKAGKAMSMPEFEKWLAKHGDELKVPNHHKDDLDYTVDIRVAKNIKDDAFVLPGSVEHNTVKYV